MKAERTLRTRKVGEDTFILRRHYDYSTQIIRCFKVDGEWDWEPLDSFPCGQVGAALKAFNDLTRR